MYMKDSIKYDDEGGKDFGCAADELTPQACYRSASAGTSMPRRGTLMLDGATCTTIF
jgi:hypothetical protein